MWYVKIVEGTANNKGTEWSKIGKWLSFKAIAGVSPPQGATRQEVVLAWIAAWHNRRKVRMKVVRVYWKESHTPTSEGGSVINTKLVAIGPKMPVMAG